MQDTFQEEADHFEDIAATVSKCDNAQKAAISGALSSWFNAGGNVHELQAMSAKVCTCEECEFHRNPPKSALRFGYVAQRGEADFTHMRFPDTPEHRIAIATLMCVSVHDLNYALEDDGECETNEHFCDFVPA